MDFLAIRQFADKLAASGPPPGGGSVAAISGLLAVSLLEMILKISDEAEYKSRQKQMENLRTLLTDLAGRDAEALADLLGAKQEETICETARKAARVPLDTARACLEVLELCQVLWGKIVQHAIGDLSIAALNAHAGIKGALTGTVMNVPLLGEEIDKKALMDQVILINEIADTLFAGIQDKVTAKEPYSLLAKSQKSE